MQQQEYERLSQMAWTHCCPKHPDKELVVAWGGDGRWVMRCGGGHIADVLERMLTPTEAFKQGIRGPVFMEDQIKRRLGMTEPGQDNHHGAPEARLPAIYEATTGQMVKGEVQKALITWAFERGLDPRLNHVCLYHGKPWVEIAGWYFRFRKKYQNGCLTTRALTFNERSERMLDKKTHAWIAEVYDRQGGDLLSQGYGYASEGEEPLAKGSAVEGRWPWRMAEKRAEEDALQKAVPLELREG